MQIVVTGAGGRLGLRACEELTAAGHDVLGMDLTATPGRHVVADLRDPAACVRHFAGADAVVHTGGVLSCNGESDEAVYVQNLAMAFHVFSAAAACGVRKVLYASSIQVLGWGGADPGTVWGFRPDYLPLDDRLPRRPASLYALNKAAAEDLLEHFSRAAGFEAVSLRFPRLLDGANVQWLDDLKRERNCWIVMRYPSAARLIRCCLESRLPGYRAYLAADADLCAGRTRQEFTAIHYPGVPIRESGSAISRFVDVSRVTAETGWQPGLS